ncbi:MAG: transposase [Chloroflexi bacterium]|nr:transposase [Chloroflexota bacterium]
MPRRTIQFVPGEYYHLYNRGNNRQNIFFERENYLFFLRQIRLYLAPQIRTSEVCKGIVVAYCLMPNHFHLLLTPQSENLSHQMQLLSISFTKAMNRRYSRVGALFQGAFQAVHVERNEHLLHLSRYIHLNPVAAGLVRRPEDWEFSSYRDYIGQRNGALPAPGIILSQFSSCREYQSFVESYAEHDLSVIAHLLIDD